MQKPSFTFVCVCVKPRSQHCRVTKHLQTAVVVRGRRRGFEKVGGGDKEVVMVTPPLLLGVMM